MFHPCMFQAAHLFILNFKQQTFDCRRTVLLLLAVVSYFTAFRLFSWKSMKSLCLFRFDGNGSSTLAPTHQMVVAVTT